MADCLTDRGFDRLPSTERVYGSARETLILTAYMAYALSHSSNMPEQLPGGV